MEGALTPGVNRMLSNISAVQLLIVLVIVLAIFGTKRLRTLGSDLGSAVKGFRSAVNEAEKEPAEQIGDQSSEGRNQLAPGEIVALTVTLVVAPPLALWLVELGRLALDRYNYRVIGQCQRGHRDIR